MKRFLASIIIALLALAGGEFSHAQTPSHLLALSSKAGSCPASVRQGLPSTAPCPKVDFNPATGQAWVQGSGFVPLSSLASITNTTGGYVQNWDGSLTWKFGPVQNLIFPSQGNYNSANFGKSNVTATDNVVTAPDGSLTGSTLTDNTTNGNHQINEGVSVTSGSTYFLSAYSQPGTLGFAQLTYQSTQFSGLGYVNINLTTCTVASSGGTFVAVGAVLDRGWCRYWIGATATATGSASAFVIMVTNGSAARSQTYVGTGSTINLWGYQVEAASYATQTTPGPYVPTTSGVASSAAQLRVGTGMGVLPEESRTNIARNSGSPSLWSLNTAVTVNASSTTGPDNATQAQSVAADGTTSQHYASDGNWSFAVSTQYTATIIAKKNTANYLHALISSDNGYVQWSLADGSVVFSASGAGTLATPTPCTNLALGFIKCTLTYTRSAAGTSQLRVYPLAASSNQAGPSEASTASIYLWAVQAEAGAFATSYYPTAAAAGTRAQDQITAAGALLSALQATSGTVMASTLGLNLNGGGRIFATANNTSLLFNTTTSAQFSDGAASQIANFGVGSTNGVARIVGSHDASTSSVSVNGSAVSSGAFAYSAGSNVWIGNLQSAWNRALNGYLTRLVVWTQKLPDTTVQALSNPALSPALALDFANGSYLYNGYNIGSAGLSSLFSVSNSGGYCTNGAGQLINYASANSLRICSGTGLLPEDTRTNVIVGSRDMTTSWTKNQLTDGATTPTPDPNFTATLRIPTAIATNHFFKADSGLNLVSFSTGVKYTWSILFKPAGYTKIFFEKPNAGCFGWTTAPQFDSATGLFTSTSGWDSQYAAQFSGGWWYLTFSATAIGNCTNTPAFGAIYINTYGSFTGDGVSGVYLANAQLEVGASFPTSYIATTTAPVTRNFDNIQALGPVLNLLGTQGAGSMMAAWQGSPYYASNLAPARQYAVAWNDGGNTRWSVRSADSSGGNGPVFNVGDGTATTNVPATAGLAAGTATKFAWRWSNTTADAAASINGGATSTASRQFGSTLAAPVYFGTGGTSGNNLNAPLGLLQFFPGGLTNAGLQAQAQ